LPGISQSTTSSTDPYWSSCFAKLDAVDMLEPAFTWRKKRDWRFTCTWPFFFVPTLTIDLWARKRLPSLDVCWKNQNNVYKILQSLASKIVTYSLFCLSSQPRFTLQPWSCNLRNKWESALVPLNSGILGLHLFWIRFSVRACVNGIVSW
jgi:hypothetical protein